MAEGECLAESASIKINLHRSSWQRRDTDAKRCGQDNGGADGGSRSWSSHWPNVKNKACGSGSYL